MAFMKYIRINGKRYGPYLYENKRDGDKVITSYIGKKSNFGSGKKRVNSIFVILTFFMFLFVFLMISQLDLRKNITGAAIGEINVSDCMELSKENYVYRVMNDISSNRTCFLIKANNVTILGNNHTLHYSGDGIKGYGVEIKGANNSIIRELKISESKCFGKENYGIYGKFSENLTLKNSDIITCSSSALSFESAKHGLIQGINIKTEDSYGIDVLSGENNIAVRDASIISEKNSGVHFGEDTSGTVIFYNVSLAKKNITFSLSSRINLYRSWYIDLNVKDLDNNFAEGARVVVRNSAGVSIFSDLTNSSGDIKRRSMLEYYANSSSIFYGSNYKINVTKKGFVEKVVDLNVTENKKVKLNFGGYSSDEKTREINGETTETTREINEDDSSQGSSEIESCTPVWECSEWSGCIESKKYRECNVINECADTSDKPFEEIDCEITKLFFLDYYPTNRLNTENGETVSFVMDVFTNNSFDGKLISVKWYLNGDLMKEDKSRDYLNSVFINSFYYNKSDNFVEAEVTVDDEKEFVFWEVSVLNITCEELWHCDWTECDEENVTYPYNCVDLNNCQTNLGKPVKERCICVTKWDCEEWGECETFYDADYIFDDRKITGEYSKKKERNCVDLSNCEDKRTEYMACGEKKSIMIREAEWCGDSYTEIIDSSSDSLVGRIKTTRKNDFTRVDLGILFDGQRGYCSNCFNNVKDFDEKDIDCGGECKACEMNEDNIVDTDQIAWSILFVITFLLSVIGIYIGIKIYNVAISFKEHKKKY